MTTLHEINSDAAAESIHQALDRAGLNRRERYAATSLADLVAAQVELLAIRQPQHLDPFMVLKGVALTLSLASSEVEGWSIEAPTPIPAPEVQTPEDNSVVQEQDRTKLGTSIIGVLIFAPLCIVALLVAWVCSRVINK